MRIPVLALALVLSTSTAAADPSPPGMGFVEAELGGGMATASASLVAGPLAIVARAHATATLSNGVAFSSFCGAGVQLRIAPREDPHEYWFFELVASSGPVKSATAVGSAPRCASA